MAGTWKRAHQDHSCKPPAGAPSRPQAASSFLIPATSHGCRTGHWALTNRDPELSPKHHSDTQNPTGKRAIVRWGRPGSAMFPVSGQRSHWQWCRMAKGFLSSYRSCEKSPRSCFSTRPQRGCSARQVGTVVGRGVRTTDRQRAKTHTGLSWLLTAFLTLQMLQKLALTRWPTMCKS